MALWAWQTDESGRGLSFIHLFVQGFRRLPHWPPAGPRGGGGVNAKAPSGECFVAAGPGEECCHPKQDDAAAAVAALWEGIGRNSGSNSPASTKRRRSCATRCCNPMEEEPVLWLSAARADSSIPTDVGTSGWLPLLRLLPIRSVCKQARKSGS
ncbi:uncharacterized protein [Physcomitrium patens]|uniref:uncharacterized protein n=1 Tax=Physcomitrium patens TaxID=3218 RepID=UPI003CCD259F